MFHQIVSILATTAIFLAAYGVGRTIVRRLGVGDEDGLSSGVWSLTLGLLVGGLAIAIMGLLGVLYASSIAVLTTAACFWAVSQIIRDQIQQYERLAAHGPSLSTYPEPSPAGAAPSRWIAYGLLALAGLASLGSLVGALAPPTAGDALCYHLELPKAFLAAHSLAFLPYQDNSTFPLLTEMWYLWGLALDGAVTAGLIHWSLGVLLALATVVLATPILGRSWAWMAGGLVLLVPGVNNQMTAPLNDLALALMTTLTVAAWWRAVVNQEETRWLVLAGLAAGGALGVKYTAVIFVAAVAMASCWMAWQRPQRRRVLLHAAAILPVLAVSVGGLWYLRAAWHRGNPVFPLACEVFQGSAHPDSSTLPASKSPLGRSPLALAAAPWQITMHPERFGGRGHQLGVLLLAALPGLLFARRLRGLNVLIAIAVCYGLIWFFLRQNVRFLFPVVPLAAVGVAWVWIEMRRFPAAARITAGAAQAAMLVLFALVALERSHDRLAVSLGLERCEDYLERAEPSYPAAAVANAMLGPQDHILSQDYRAFYFKCPVTHETVFRRETHYDRNVNSAPQLSRTLRHAGFTHLLLAENLNTAGVQFDPTLGRLADAGPAQERNQAIVKILDYTRPDSDGALRRYRLMMLR